MYQSFKIYGKVQYSKLLTYNLSPLLVREKTAVKLPKSNLGYFDHAFLCGGLLLHGGVRCSSVVRVFAHGAMGRQIDPSWSGPIELFLVPASAPRRCNKGCGMYNPVCGMMHIKEPLLLIEKSSSCGGSRFPLLLSEWSFI